MLLPSGVVVSFSRNSFVLLATAQCITRLFLFFSEYLVPLLVVHAPALPRDSHLTLALIFNRDALTSLTLPNSPCSHSSTVYRLLLPSALWTPYGMSTCRMQCHPMSVSKAYCMDFERKDVSNSQYFLFLYRLQYFSFFLFFLLPFLFLYAQKFLSSFLILVHLLVAHLPDFVI